jgi:hypothetical protein
MDKDSIIVQSYSSGYSTNGDAGDGVYVASGDVNGDTDALGPPVTFTFTVTPSLGSPEERSDGTSNTLMYAEKFQLEDGAYVLTAIEHAGIDTLHAIGGVTVASGDVDGATDTFEFDFCDGGTAADIGTGTWIMDTTYETGSHLLYQDVFVPPPLETGPAVAMETLTIGHEGFWLL